MTSHLQKERLKYIPKTPPLFHELKNLKVQKNATVSPLQKEIEDLFPYTKGNPFLKFTKGSTQEFSPLKVGCVFSGGQAPGGHNVLAGVFDALKKLNENSTLYGFLGGPSGVVSQQYMEITKEKLSLYRNMGGFDMIGSGRTKIETMEQFAAVQKNMDALQLDGLIIIGGDDSNTNAANLAEFFLAKNVFTKVVGVPKTIDGDLKSKELQIPFGFDTACKVFAETIGNIARDAISAKKYYFFIKVMGRSASHIALECALKVHPTLTLIGEEVLEKNYSYEDIVKQIADVICERSLNGKEYGVIVIPEGLIEFIPEFTVLIKELNTTPVEKLTKASSECYKSLPETIQKQLVLDRDPHGNVQVSKIETERLFIEGVEKELKKRGKNKLASQPLFLGYEGRSAYPSNFDADYCYNLGQTSALLIAHGASGYMALVQNLDKKVEEWQPAGLPLTSLMHMESRKGKDVPVIKKALVDLSAEPFQTFAKNRQAWAIHDDFLFPGPLQFFGPPELTDSKPISLYI